MFFASCDTIITSHYSSCPQPCSNSVNQSVYYLYPAHRTLTVTSQQCISKNKHNKNIIKIKLKAVISNIEPGSNKLEHYVLSDDTVSPLSPQSFQNTNKGCQKNIMQCEEAYPASYTILGVIIPAPICPSESRQGVSINGKPHQFGPKGDESLLTSSFLARKTGSITGEDMCGRKDLADLLKDIVDTTVLQLTATPLQPFGSISDLSFSPLLFWNSYPCLCRPIYLHFGLYLKLKQAYQSPITLPSLKYHQPSAVSPKYLHIASSHLDILSMPNPLYGFNQAIAYLI